MWMEVSAILFLALVSLSVRYKFMEARYMRVMRCSIAAMAHLRTERRLSENEPPVPGQGKML